jgi:outer membrane protein TolC
MQQTVRISGLMIFALFLATLTCTHVNAQHISSARHKNDSTAAPLFRTTQPPPPPVNADSLIQEKLVELALQGPQYLTTNHLIKISEYQLSTAKKSWLNLLTISTNINDQTFNNTQVSSNGTTYIYPKYFFSLTIPLGVIFSMGPQIKGAKESVEVAHNNQDQKARDLRAEVLTKYKTYKNYGQLIGLQNTVVVDEQAAVTLAEKKFKDGTISIEQYNQANKAYNNDLAAKLNLQLAQDIIKLDIEKMIGTNLDNIIK